MYIIAHFLSFGIIIEAMKEFLPGVRSNNLFEPGALGGLVFASHDFDNVAVLELMA